MPSFSKTSTDRLATCHPILRVIFNEVVKTFDCTIICGHRGEDEQNAAVAEGKSQTPWPTSKHNQDPSWAVDAAPYPIDWNDRDRFVLFAGFVLGVASQLGYSIRWGGCWANDLNPRSNRGKLDDLVHFELAS